jgi:hypothetical protein
MTGVVPPQLINHGWGSSPRWNSPPRRNKWTGVRETYRQITGNRWIRISTSITQIYSDHLRSRNRVPLKTFLKTREKWEELPQLAWFCVSLSSSRNRPFWPEFKCMFENCTFHIYISHAFDIINRMWQDVTGCDRIGKTVVCRMPPIFGPRLA